MSPPRSRIQPLSLTVLPSEKNQWDEGQNVERGNGKECPRLGPASVTDQCIDGGKNRRDRHGARQREADKARAAMNVYAASRDQQSLCDEKKNPAGKDCAVDVNQAIGEGRLENTGKV
ncbi:MAG TPA: hypothetical protein VIH75_01395 [Candidatus Sulfotelmatobacter sp.]